MKKLQAKVENVVKKKGYVFIACHSDDSFQLVSDKCTGNTDCFEGSHVALNHTQLFIYPKVNESISEVPSQKTLYPNINLIMIDSLSRDHLFRSLPQTINTLENLKDYSSHIVLDFAYFQAIKLRTFESLLALFAGQVDIHVKPFGTYSMPYFPLPTEVLFSKFKDRGYKTLWLEDLCWKWEWGLVKDLRVLNKSIPYRRLWANFKESLQTALIDDLGITLASCEILKSNKLNDPFHNAPAVCFNGKYHHDYILEYLQSYQKREHLLHKPLFSFTELDVSHEESGVRIQSLDSSLKKYITNIRELENTITVLFSDHGNTYGNYIERSTEAYVEGFNPFLIFIIPDKVARTIGSIKMKRIKKNSQHLISMLDIHETLLSLINKSNDKRDVNFTNKYVIPQGLWGNIPSRRTCDDLPLLMPNQCICRDFDVGVKVNHIHYTLAEFSLGVLNNLMLQDRSKINKRGFVSCQFLQVKKIRSAKERKKTGNLTQIKLEVLATGILSSVMELFFFTLELGLGDPSIRLINFERNSPYGRYKSCKDDNIDPRMCTCKPRTNKKVITSLQRLIYPDFFHFSDKELNEERKQSERQIHAFFNTTFPHSNLFIDKIYPKKDSCLFIVHHKYENGFNIYGMSVCSIIHKITLKVYGKNLFLSDKFTSNYILHPLDIKHLIAGTQENPKASWFWDYTSFIT